MLLVWSIPWHEFHSWRKKFFDLKNCWHLSEKKEKEELQQFFQEKMIQKKIIQPIFDQFFRSMFSHGRVDREDWPEMVWGVKDTAKWGRRPGQLLSFTASKAEISFLLLAQIVWWKYFFEVQASSFEMFYKQTKSHDEGSKIKCKTVT